MRLLSSFEGAALLSFFFFVVLGRGVAAVSTLFSGATIIAFDEVREVLRVVRNGSLLVTDATIAAVFDGAAPPSALPAGTESVDAAGKIISPGFIDTHRHGWQTAFRTLGPDCPLAEYVLRFSEFTAHGLAGITADDVYLGQLFGLYEALNAGTTAMLDHAHHTWSNDTAEAGLRACIDSGARVFWAYAFHDVAGVTTVREQLPHFRALAARAPFRGTPTTLAIAYDAIGRVPPDWDEIEAVMGLATEFNVSAITAHYLSGVWGAYNLVSNSPTYLHSIGYLNISTPVVLSHASFLTPNDAALLRSTNQFVSTTPESEMHYGHLHPENHLVLDQTALGVDTHFAFSGDMLTQSRLWLQTTRRDLYAGVSRQWQLPSVAPMTAEQAFLLATRQGALALRRPDLGIIAPGARADLVVWDADNSPAMLAWSDPVAAVVLHASVADIEAVMVDGRWVKRHGRLVAEGFSDLRDSFLASARRIQEAITEARPPIQRGLFMGGFPLAEPFRVDVRRGGNGGSHRAQPLQEAEPMLKDGTGAAIADQPDLAQGILTDAGVLDFEAAT